MQPVHVAELQILVCIVVKTRNSECIVHCHVVSRVLQYYSCSGSNYYCIHHVLYQKLCIWISSTAGI